VHQLVRSPRQALDGLLEPLGLLVCRLEGEQICQGNDGLQGCSELVRDLGNEQVAGGCGLGARGLRRQLGFGEFQLCQARVVCPQAVSFQEGTGEPLASCLGQGF